MCMRKTGENMTLLLSCDICIMVKVCMRDHDMGDILRLHPLFSQLSHQARWLSIIRHERGNLGQDHDNRDQRGLTLQGGRCEYPALERAVTARSMLHSEDAIHFLVCASSRSGPT